MRLILFVVLPLAACMTPNQAALDAMNDVPERAITEFNGSSVTIQAKSSASAEGNLSLARTACPGAKLQTKTADLSPVGIPASEYLYLC